MGNAQGSAADTCFQFTLYLRILFCVALVRPTIIVRYNQVDSGFVDYDGPAEPFPLTPDHDNPIDRAVKAVHEKCASLQLVGFSYVIFYSWFYVL